MKTFFKIALSIVKTASFLLTMFYAAVISVETIFGSNIVGQLMELFNLPVDYYQFHCIGYSSMIILAITCIVHIKLFKKGK